MVEVTCREKVSVEEKVREYLENEVGKVIEGHEDGEVIKPLPIETIIVGCKYD